MKIIGIAGGSGAGKSTATYMMVDNDPETYEMLNLDDYHKYRDDPTVIMQDGMINWDHPDMIKWGNLIADLKTLESGKPITIQTWSHRSNTDYQKHGKHLPRVVHPRPVLILEGYLGLYKPEINKLYDKSFYLDLDDETRHLRRNKGIFVGKDDYNNRILIPMHRKYVEPTMKNADVVIETSNLTVKQTVDIMMENL